MQVSGSLAMFKVTARDQGQYMGRLLHTVTFLVYFYLLKKIKLDVLCESSEEQ